MGLQRREFPGEVLTSVPALTTPCVNVLWAPLRNAYEFIADKIAM
jgi:hypothetical protein